MRHRDAMMVCVGCYGTLASSLRRKDAVVALLLLSGKVLIGSAINLTPKS